MHVVLIGLMGSGKSTVGTMLAARLARPFLDNDAMLERRTGRRARDIAAAEGVDRLHELEADVLADALSAVPAAVIAAAAAAPLGEVLGLGGHTTLYLHATPAVLAARLRAADDDHRPLLDTGIDAVLRGQYESRDSAYRAIAQFVADAEQAPAAIVDDITQWLESNRT
jgi:shikimate kinase